jgi:hypothetical protein
VTDMEIIFDSQHIPADIAEACAWLSAAERFKGAQPGTGLQHRLAAADALDILHDVRPPYAPIDTSRQPMPLTEAAGAVMASLGRALREPAPVQQRLRVGRALGVIRQALP